MSSLHFFFHTEAERLLFHVLAHCSSFLKGSGLDNNSVLKCCRLHTKKGARATRCPERAGFVILTTVTSPVLPAL